MKSDGGGSGGVRMMEMRMMWVRLVEMRVAAGENNGGESDGGECEGEGNKARVRVVGVGSE